MSDQASGPAPRVSRQRRQRLREATKAEEIIPAAEAAPKARAVVERPPVRTDIRDDIRLDPRASASERAREIMEHGGLDNVEGTDKYYIEKSIIPDGWTYEWKTRTVYGLENPSYQVALQRTGWREVPASRHPEMMPKGWTGNVIELDGQVLMERPAVITEMIANADKKRARDQVRVKEQQLSSAPSKDQMPRAQDPGGDQRTAPKINRAYEPMQVPADK